MTNPTREVLEATTLSEVEPVTPLAAASVATKVFELAEYGVALPVTEPTPFVKTTELDGYSGLVPRGDVDRPDHVTVRVPE